MRSKSRRTSRKRGLPPGTLVHVGAEYAGDVSIRVMAYGPDSLLERRVATPAEALSLCRTAPVVWIDVEGVHRTEVIAAFGQALDLHPLTQEDILHTEQRTKEEGFPRYHYIVLRMLTPGEEGDVASEQVSMILGQGFLITFQERPGDVFDPVRARIRDAGVRLRTMGADYLAYRLMDAIIDGYFPVLEMLGDRIETLEDGLVAQPGKQSLSEIHSMKRSMLLLRKSVWPLREVVGSLGRGDSPLFGADTRIFMRDLYDHVIQVMDTVETQRDTLSGMLDIYLTGVSNRMNEVMKVLTIMSSIFIPLTFIAGVYGMNFEFMPELNHRWGYPAILGLMAATALGLIAYFKRRRWF